MNGELLQAARGRMGEILHREAPVPGAELVIAVPDSGTPAARGFARAAGLPQDDGLIKNRYIARTFIQPGQELRKHGLRLKFNPLPEVVAGKRLVVVDDSIVRGNTTRQIVQMLRDAGASEVHMRISAPPIRHPCHYGIDMSTREEMIAHGRTVEEVAAELGADSLAYISLAGVYEAVRGEPGSHCDIWQPFTDEVLRAVVDSAAAAPHFILWGRHALGAMRRTFDCRFLVANPDEHGIRRVLMRIYNSDTYRYITYTTSAHPSPLSADRGFFGSRPFSRANIALQLSGVAPIDWRLS